MTATITLTAGQKYPIKVEYRELGGVAFSRLEWLRPGQLSQTIVPQSQLYPAQWIDDLPDTMSPASAQVSKPSKKAG